MLSGRRLARFGIPPHLTLSVRRRILAAECLRMGLKEHIREIPDFPTPGILFRDITPLLGHPKAFRLAVDQLAERFASEPFDAVAAIESRGFVFAAPLAYRLGVPLVPVRKEGKLPFDTHSVTYALEYGSDTLEIHVDAIREGSRTLIVDDLLATGGTAAATVRLVERSGASVAGLAFVIELTDLGGRDALAGYRVESLVAW